MDQYVSEKAVGLFMTNEMQFPGHPRVEYVGVALGESVVVYLPVYVWNACKLNDERDDLLVTTKGDVED